jgi:hypothetical protein
MQQLPDEFEYSALKILVAKDLCDKSISQDRKITRRNDLVGGFILSHNSSTIPTSPNVSYFRYPILKAAVLKTLVLCAFDDHESERIMELIPLIMVIPFFQNDLY